MTYLSKQLQLSEKQICCMFIDFLIISYKILKQVLLEILQKYLKIALGHSSKLM